MSKYHTSPLEHGEILSDSENNVISRYSIDISENDKSLTLSPSKIQTSAINNPKQRRKHTLKHKCNPKPQDYTKTRHFLTRPAQKTIDSTEKSKSVPNIDKSEDSMSEETLQRKIARAKEIRLERQGCFREVLSSSSESEDESVAKIAKNDDSSESEDSHLYSEYTPSDKSFQIVEESTYIPPKLPEKDHYESKNDTLDSKIDELCQKIDNSEHKSDTIAEKDCKNVLPAYFPAIQGCRFVDEYSNLSRVEEGSYGIVFQARDKTTGDLVALKRLKMENEKDGFPITSLREVSTLLKAPHENIVRVREIVVGSHIDRIYVVMDFVQTDLKSLIEAKKQPFRIGEVKCLLKQLLTAVAHIHANWILHRDIKTSNILISDNGVLKLGDFGSAREYGSPLKNYTPVIVTLWYRSPELLLGIKRYSTKVDVWSVGCVFAEMLLMKALWPMRSEISQLQAIFKDLGSPSEQIWPGFLQLEGAKIINLPNFPYNSLRNRFGNYLSNNGFKLLNSFFRYCPEKRVSAEQALGDQYLMDEPRPVHPSMMPIDRFLSDKPLTPKPLFSGYKC